MFFNIIAPTWFMNPTKDKINQLRNHCSPNEQFDGLIELFMDCLKNLGHNRLHYSTKTAFFYALSKSDIIWVADHILRNKLYNNPQPIKRGAEIILLYFWLYFAAVLQMNMSSKSLRNTMPAWVQPLGNIIMADGRIKRSRGIKSCKVLLDILSEHLPELSHEYPWLESVIDLLKQILAAKSIDAIFDLPNA